MAAAPALEKVAECGVGGGYPLGQEVGPVFRLGVAYQSVFGLSNGGFVKYFFCNRFICYFFSLIFSKTSVGSCPGVLCAGVPCADVLCSGVHVCMRPNSSSTRCVVCVLFSLELSEICR